VVSIVDEHDPDNARPTALTRTQVIERIRKVRQ